MKNTFDWLQVLLASPQDILSWSSWAVESPDTINYRTGKPKQKWLFCEAIFWPMKNFECSCGKYKWVRYRGIVCERCGVEVTTSRVRRERMGHIELAAPVVHVRYIKATPSRIGLLLNLSINEIEKILYFVKYVVTAVNKEQKKNVIAQLDKDYHNKVNELDMVFDKERKTQKENLKGKKEKEVKVQTEHLIKVYETNKWSLEKEYSRIKSILSNLDVWATILESDYRNVFYKYEGAFTFSSGSEAILALLKDIDIKEEISDLLSTFGTLKGETKKKMFKKLKLLINLYISWVKPEWMVLTHLPVIPPDLRPVVQLEWGKFASSDVNLFYRRVLMRNLRLKKMIQVGMPDVVKKNEIRLLQESVNNLLVWEKWNTSGPKWSNKVFKSLTDMLSGKEWIFRKNLLGKRVDYSWRSVITIWPGLKLDECGLPLYLAVKMFTPFIIGKLIERKIAHTPKQAEKLIKDQDPIALRILEEVIEGKYVLLNRAPTLHRLSIQAFKIKLMPGKTIRIHPLVTPAFNADFDGDQMAVHLPLSEEAQKEAEMLIASDKNVLKPSSWEPVITHSQDLVLWVYYLTDETWPNEKHTLKEINEHYNKHHEWKDVVGKYAGLDEVMDSFNSSNLDVKNRILLKVGNEHILTTVGRAIFNHCLPEKARFINEKVGKKWLKEVLNVIYDIYGREKTVHTADDLKDLWFFYATKSAVTINVFDLIVPAQKEEILANAGDKVNSVHTFRFKWFLSDVEKHKQIITIWSEAKAEIERLVKDGYSSGNDIFNLIDSKARGNRWQLTQMAWMKWLVASPSWEIIELPIKSSLLEGFSPIEYFISAHGARKGKADTALRTAESGYLTRRLVDSSQEAIIREEDCKTKDFILITEAEAKMRHEPFDSLIFGRVASQDIKDSKWNVIVKKDTLLDSENVRIILDAGVDTVWVRSPLTCHTVSWICQKCFWMDLSTRQQAELGSPVWIISSQSIWEPGTQLTMRTFHSGWVASMDGDMTQGIKRVEELFEVRNPKKPAVLCPFDGTATVVEWVKKQEVEITSEPIPVVYVIKPEYSAMVKKGDEITKWGNYAEKWRSKLKIKGWGRVLEVNKDHIVLGEIQVVRKKVAVWTSVKIKNGQEVFKWQLLTSWWIDIREYMTVVGELEAQRYIVTEIKKVYTSQWQDVNDKYMETIVKQLFSKIMIEDAGNSSFVPGTIVKYESMLSVNRELEAQWLQPAKGQRLALWLTQVAKESDSWMSAASFQETIRVMVEASTRWAIDPLDDLKSNVIIGRLLPVGEIYKKSYHELQNPENALEGIIEAGNIPESE